MRLNSRLPVFALLVMLLAGCGTQTPLQTALDAHTAYDLGLSSLIAARQAGKIDDATKAKIEAVRVPVYAAILQMDAAAVENNQATFTAALNQYKALLPLLQKYIVVFKSPSPALK